jgi:phosphoenolpyruvate-protein kinase (PTS system EI component)
MRKVGKGLSCSIEDDVIGELVYIKTIEDVIALFDKAQGKICLVDDAGTTTLGPILSELSGVICTTGGPGSHLAIVSREFEIACIMSLTFFNSMSLDKLDGKKAKIITEEDNKGILYLLD